MENTMEIPQKSTGMDGETDRGKTSLRLRYEAETNVIQKKIGSLEEVRISLGLSRRKMAQLLMVDPSAWTRWTRTESSAPPHIYRSLQWYLALIDKNAAWHPQNSFLSNDTVKLQEERLLQIKEEWQKQIAYLKRENNRLEFELNKRVTLLEEFKEPSQHLAEMQQSIGVGWKLIVFLNFLGLILIFLFKYIV